MVCERCKEREANTHLTVILEKAGETEHHLCEVCYPEFEAYRNKTYNTQVATPLRADFEAITAKEFVEMQERARRNSVDMPAWKQLFDKLSQLSDVKERLSFEAIPLAWEYLNSGTEPPHIATMLVGMFISPTSNRLAEHTDWVEKMIFKTFELRKALPYDPGKHGPFCLTFMNLLTPLSTRSPELFDKIIASLKAKGADAKEPRWNIITRLEESARKRRDSSFPGP
jgi:hypothetical protein